MGRKSRQILSLIAILTLSGSCRHDGETTVNTTAEDSLRAAADTITDTTPRDERTLFIDRELDYYLKRHNVVDEGFDMVARYAEEHDSSMNDYLPEGHFPPANLFRWKDFPREGKGMERDLQGRIVIGMYHADTLVSGLRIDSMGTYAGQLDSHAQANGHGSYRTAANGNYYEGHWKDDCRDGFGFSILPGHLKAGQWRNDRFLGEHMKHTTERIYGIDISRFQHDIGKKTFPINWQQLHISSLGRRIGQERVVGQVDYPVNFVYIKATEGITIINRYFTSDYLACHRQNIRVGAYHFFSLRQTPEDQVHHFLQNARFTHGDMPPMLDIEPSDDVIVQTGGAERMFKNIRTWLQLVEKATGCRPLLYINQRFVNTWLDMAPDLKENYHFWIARYGEYKPDIHLSFWQLSDEGRVNGIQGSVDINVFNGYQGQWDEFLREETVK